MFTDMRREVIQKLVSARVFLRGNQREQNESSDSAAVQPSQTTHTELFNQKQLGLWLDLCSHDQDLRQA